MPPRILFVDDPSERHHQAIVEPLKAFNDAHVGVSPRAHFALILEEPDTGAIVGGLWAEIARGWLFVDLLFVPEALRGRRLGSELLARAEALARERGCVGVHLQTAAFQARGFYEKQGYQVFGTLEDHPVGSRTFYFAKRLAPLASARQD